MANKMAQRLRQNLTVAEKRLWTQLRRRQLGNNFFRRQAPIGPYVVDFVCFERNLVIEVDGSQHATRVTHDGERTKWLERRGYQVIRFWNNDVLQNTEGVVVAILEHLGKETEHPLPNPPPSRGRE